MPRSGPATRNDGRVVHTGTTVQAHGVGRGGAGPAGHGSALGRGLVGLPGVVIATLVLAFGAAATLQSLRTDTAEAEADVAQEAAGVFETFATTEAETLQRILILAARTARAGPPALPSLPRDAERLTDVAFVTAGPGEVRVVSGALPDTPARLGTMPGLAGMFALSRDATEADIVLSAPVDGPPPKVYAAVAVFHVPGGGLRATPPTDTTERRASIAGWVVARVDPAPVLSAALPPGLAGRIRDGDLLLAGSNELPDSDDVIGRPVSVGGRRWTIEVWDPTNGSGGLDAYWWLLAAVLGAAAVLQVDILHRRRRRQAEERADNALGHVELVADLAPVVQRSLELGEVLPAVATALVSDLGLAGLVFAEAESDNEFRDVFSIGTVNERPSHLGGGSLAPDESLSITLQRGSRAVGMLRIKAGRGLETDDLRCIRIAAELATAAIVTAQLFAQQEEAVERLQELDALKSIFLATASHELRTPLVAIAGFSSILRDQWDQLSDDEHRLFTTRIANNAQSLSTLIEGLLDFSRLEQGAFEVRLEPIDLSAKVGAVLEQLAPTFEAHVLQSDLAPGSVVAADAFGIERIVTNLVSNAVKYSPAGSTVTVRVEQRDGRTRLAVSDEGAGVPVEQRERIFSRFFRGDGDAVVRSRGVGIGLSVAKEFADQMGATIEVSSSPSGGAEFVLSFPSPGSAPAPVIEEESHAPLS